MANMDSPFGQLFLAVQERIRTLNFVRHIDQDLGQLDFYDTVPPVTWPCILIDIDEFEFDERGDNSEMGVGAVVIRLGYPPLSSTSTTVPDTFKNKALQFYNWEYIVHKSLQGWRPIDDIFGALIRKSCATEKREDKLRVRRSVYTIGMDDNSTAWPEYTTGSDYNEDYNSDYGPARPNVDITVE